MFGTGIQSYFSFLRFLVMLNLIIFVLMFSFVMLPIIVAPHASGNISYNLNDGEEIFFLFPVWLFAFHLINVLGGVSPFIFPCSYWSPNTSVDHVVLFIYFGKNGISSQIETFP